MIAIFLTSGLFLGWSLGANDAANVFGTAVGTRMLRFRTAAIIASIFVVLGAVTGGAGAADTLGKLGSINTLAGSFMVALGAAITVSVMTKLQLPVSTSQAIVGAIIGWNIFSSTITDFSTLTKIVSTWLFCPAISAVVAVILYFMFKYLSTKAKIHLLIEDILLRWGLIIVGAFGSYSLGANNIANVMGVFIDAVPLENLHLFGNVYLTSTQQLFFLGSIAISIGIISYSHKVMQTVGNSLLKLSPVTALIVVLSQSIVLFLFASQGLKNWLLAHHLPSLPLVPVSSSQAVVGAVLGIGLVKGGKNFHFKTLGKISSGWVTTPIIAGIVTLIGLYFLQNVFLQNVYEPETFKINTQVLAFVKDESIHTQQLEKLYNKNFPSSSALLKTLQKDYGLSRNRSMLIVQNSKLDSLKIEPSKIKSLKQNKIFTAEQIQLLQNLNGETFSYRWQFEKRLNATDVNWTTSQITYLFEKFKSK